MRMCEYHGRAERIDFSKPTWFERACAMSDMEWRHLKRGDRTRLLSDMLVKQVFNYPDPRTYWAREVTVNQAVTTDMGISVFGNRSVRHSDARVDFMRVAGSVNADDPLPRCGFTCYEVKSCKADIESGHGLNFLGNLNYVVCPPFLVEEVKNHVPDDIGVYSTTAETSPDGYETHAFKQVRQAKLRTVSLEMKGKMLLCMMRCAERDMLQYVEYNNHLVEYEDDNE